MKIREVMKARVAFAASIAALMLAALPASHAEIMHLHMPIHASIGNHQKMVKFSLHNDTGTPLELKMGDKVETLQVGQTLGVKLPVGTRVTTNTATENHPAGALIVEVSAGMYSDSTISIKK